MIINNDCYNFSKYLPLSNSTLYYQSSIPLTYVYMNALQVFPIMILIMLTATELIVLF